MLVCVEAGLWEPGSRGSIEEHVSYDNCDREGLRSEPRLEANRQRQTNDHDVQPDSRCAALWLEICLMSLIVLV